MTDASNRSPAPTRAPSVLALYLSGSGISLLGDGLHLGAMALLGASVTSNPADYSLILAAGKLPWLLFAIPIGVFLDHARHTATWMIAINTLRGLLMLGFAWSIFRGSLGLGLLCGFVFAFGLGEAFVDLAQQGLLPRLLRRGELELVNGRFATVQMAADQFIGPPIGGWLFALAPCAAFLLDGVSFLIASVCFLPTRAVPDVVVREPRKPVLKDLASGLTFLVRAPMLRRILFIATIMSAIMGSVLSLLGLFAVDDLGLGNAKAGLLYSCLAAGSMVAGLLTTRLIRASGHYRSALYAVVTIGLVLMATHMATSLVAVGALFVVLGAALTTWDVAVVSYRQAHIPAAIFGRANSAYRFMGLGAVALGAVVGGRLAERWGIQNLWLGAGLVSLALAAFALAFPMGRSPALAEEPAE